MDNKATIEAIFKTYIDAFHFMKLLNKLGVKSVDTTYPTKVAYKLQLGSSEDISNNIWSALDEYDGW